MTPKQPVDLLFERIEEAPTAVAVGGAPPMTYAELGAAVNAVAAALQAVGGVATSRVGICAKNSTEHLIALLATYAAGKVWIPLNPRNGRADLDRMIATTAPTVIVADESCATLFSPVAVPVILGRTTTGAKDVRPNVRRLMVEWVGHRPQRLEREESGAQVLKFSGGSTGTPKAVIQSMRCINAQAEGLLRHFEFTADDVNLIAAPLTHGASCFVLPIFAAGGRHVMLEDGTPTAILDVIAREEVTTMYAPPTLLYGMLGAVKPGARFPTLRHVIYSAAPMSAARIRDCQRVFGPVIETAYGQVEAPQIIASMRADELMREENLESVGRPSSVAHVRIVDPSGADMGNGEVGEIVVSGPLVMTGYLDRPDETRAAIVDGWLRTGDLGCVDERGYLFIRGRSREVINTGGFKVYPAEVEAVLMRHPGVLECAVVGLPDPKWGEAVTAAVVRGDAGVEADELIAFVKAEIGSVKAPKSVRFVEALPRNAAGKVSRGEVRALLE